MIVNFDPIIDKIIDGYYPVLKFNNISSESDSSYGGLYTPCSYINIHSGPHNNGEYYIFEVGTFTDGSMLIKGIKSDNYNQDTSGKWHDSDSGGGETIV